MEKALDTPVRGRRGAAKARNTRRQPQRVPPPLLSGAERVDGEGILAENPGDEGMVLWKTYRSLSLWTQLKPDQRRELISEEGYASRLAHLGLAQGLQEVRAPVLGLAEILRKPPHAASIVGRCRAIEEWADSRGAVRTAVEFAQLAALAAPLDATLATRLARRIRDLADYARAESWYGEAIVRARKASDWQAYVTSKLGLGITIRIRGNYVGARRNLERGLRRARRQGLQMLEAMALHELAVVGILTDNLTQTLKYGRLALHAYGPDHARVPWLAHDLAVFWMNRGYFGAALDVFVAIPDEIGTGSDQLVRFAGTARASGAMGSVARFDLASQAAERLLEDPRNASKGSSALLDMARGALSLELLDKATELVTRGQSLAKLHGEAEKGFEAEGLLQEIASADAASRASTVPAPPRVAALASELVESLATAAA